MSLRALLSLLLLALLVSETEQLGVNSVSLHRNKLSVKFLKLVTHWEVKELLFSLFSTPAHLRAAGSPRWLIRLGRRSQKYVTKGRALELCIRHMSFVIVDFIWV
jgi:hypothetical protein